MPPKNGFANKSDAPVNYIKRYDNREYEEKLFYFNTVTRTSYYKHEVDGVEGLDHCFDCASEIVILQQYLQKFSNLWYHDSVYDATGKVPQDKVNKEVASRMNQISVECATSGNEYHHRTLATLISRKQKWFQPRLFDNERNTIKAMIQAFNPINFVFVIGSTSDGIKIKQLFFVFAIVISLDVVDAARIIRQNSI